MKAIDRLLPAVITGHVQFVIPVFQRDYSWNEEQCDQLWSDILKAAAAPGDQGHFLGSIVSVPASDTGMGLMRSLVIDGQQRLTTLMLLLTALRDHLRAETDAASDDRAQLANQIQSGYLLNPDFFSESERPKLVLRRQDHSTLTAIIRESERPEESSPLITEAYDGFRSKLGEFGDHRTVFRGITKLAVVEVNLTRDDRPQLVFESLNSTGVALSQSDQIRNFILMDLQETEQTRLYNEYWSRIESEFKDAPDPPKVLDSFAGDYLALHTKAARQMRSDEIYRAYKAEFASMTDADGGIEGTLRAMRRWAAHYASFTRARGPYPEVNDAIRRIKQLANSPAMLVAELARCHEERKSLSRDDLAGCIARIESYLLRRAVCGLPTRSYWSHFAQMAYQIDRENPCESFEVAMARLPEAYAFPSDEHFRQRLLEVNLYRLPSVRLHVLEGLENRGHDEPTQMSKLTIEHIMPQKINDSWKQALGDTWRDDHQTWVDRLGNLTFTAYNSRYSNRPFAEKRDMPRGFGDSAVRLNKGVARQERWTVSEMQQRTAKLAEKALGIWRGLQVDDPAKRQAIERDLRRKAKESPADRVTMTPQAGTLYGKLRPLVVELGEPEEVIELSERKHQIAYYAPDFFLEVLPRKDRLLLRAPLGVSEVEDLGEIIRDATQYKYFAGSKHDSDIYVSLRDETQLEPAMAVVRRAFAAARRSTRS